MWPLTSPSPSSTQPPTSPLTTFGDKQTAALKQLDKIFNMAAHPHRWYHLWGWIPHNQPQKRTLRHILGCTQWATYHSNQDAHWDHHLNLHPTSSPMTQNQCPPQHTKKQRKPPRFHKYTGITPGHVVSKDNISCQTVWKLSRLQYPQPAIQPPSCAQQENTGQLFTK